MTAEFLVIPDIPLERLLDVAFPSLKRYVLAFIRSQGDKKRSHSTEQRIG
jgi:hypothetical protein